MGSGVSTNRREGATHGIDRLFKRSDEFGERSDGDRPVFSYIARPVSTQLTTGA